MNKHLHALVYANLQIKCKGCGKVFSAQEACKELRITMSDLELQLDWIVAERGKGIPEPPPSVVFR
jgi:hypothetical protein